jgi:PTH1 family peptidyl-tRNA hydrolase
VIAGLGNPGREYADTRHNAGWMAADRLAELCGAREEQFRGDAVVARCRKTGAEEEAVLVKPLLYMNRSGPPVKRTLREHEASLEDLLVLVDDADLPLGSIRLRPSGSSGGHRGLRSIVESLGSREFARLRMGVGPRPRGVPMRDFVLDSFSDEEWDAVDRMVEDAARAALCWLREGAQEAMNRYNRTADDTRSP